MPLVARCWKCGKELLRIEDEYAQVQARVTCPEPCGEQNSIFYAFPTGTIALEDG